MRIALHYPGTIDTQADGRLLGIWAAPRGPHGYPDCYYPAGTPPSVFQRGKEWMGYKSPVESWPSYFEYLSEKLPYSADWSYLEVLSTHDLKTLFLELALPRGRADGEGAHFETVLPAGLPESGDLQLDTPEDVAKAIDAPGTPFTTHQRLSSSLAYFSDEERLLVVGRRTTNASRAELALAHGLAYRGDRDLWLALPQEASETTLVRAPWITPAIRIWTYGSSQIDEQVIRAPGEIWDSYSDGFETGVADLGDRQAWIAPLVDWARSIPGLQAAHRRQYLSWHCEGRSILRVHKTAQGVRIVAGVDYKNPAPGEEPFKIDVACAITPGELHRTIAAASKAAADRLDGIDASHQEHRLQAALTAEKLGLVTLEREFPAWRPPGRRGFIDFLGVDNNGRGHVVETKIGPDDLLILQGLDYWIWANAHRREIGSHFGLSKEEPSFVIDYVVAEGSPGGALVSPYTAAQAEALDGSVTWRFQNVSGWSEGVRPTRLPYFELPANSPRAGAVPARWAKRLASHLASHAVENKWKMARPTHFAAARDGLVGAAHPAYESLARHGLLHSQIAHVRSSQAFALNVFAPLGEDALRSLWQSRFGIEVVDAAKPEFEFSDNIDELREATHASPHVTQVDVLLRGHDGDGGSHIALIEVKLSEDNFGGCSAYTSNRNPRRSVCRSAGWFGADSVDCFQLANHDREHRRRYDRYLGPPPEVAQSGAGCCFRGGGNQTMRNVALARVLLERGDAQTVTCALMAPEAHQYIWRRWGENQKFFAGLEGVAFADLPAFELVADFHSTDQGNELATRYLLGSPALNPVS